MQQQNGFTLIELMIVVAIVAILSAIGIPSYQNYLQRAALTDMLQTMVPYKTAVELCTIEHGSLDSCHSGDQGIPDSRASRYVAKVSVKSGVIVLTGKENLTGLNVTLTPTQDKQNGHLTWQRVCSSDNKDLQKNCLAQFRFTDANQGGDTR